MQWSLVVLILMVQCCIFTCHLYEYHFIQDNMSWDEARSYCREHFTDLATVSNMRDMERMRNSSQTTDAWIGLQAKEGGNKPWRWSLPWVEYKESEALWENGEPNDRENCVKMDENDENDYRKWDDESCTEDNHFICYNETGQQKYFVIDEHELNWLQAQSYCREHHTDLVSGLEQINSTEFKNITKQFNNQDLWIGLFREVWSWSDGKNFSFRHWDPDSFEDEGDKDCAMTKTNEKWSPDICTKPKPFYCYDDKVILIKENKTWEEALDYCRAKHRDLVSITDSHQQRWVEKRAKMADTEFVWLGMRYTCTLDLWFWVSDRLVCYDNWAPEDKMKGCDRATAMKRDGKWYERREGEFLNFICAL
ncbi:hypothetical protein NQZ68_038788 [Dissostichus eleginoides]|nr:hypothetical protein NQZ68_038788 [Dissostichus eleginoides]